MGNSQNLEKKIGEAIGLEKASQAAVEKLSAQGLLDKDRINDKLQTIKKQDKSHQRSLEELSMDLSKSQGVSLGRIDETAKETEQKTSEIMEIYLGKDSDSSEALEFLCLAEAGGITHYEVLNAMASDIKDEKFSIDVQRILAEKKNHQQIYTELAKQISIGSR
jgi:rubrerythrin